jgi:DNA-binding response OmpR family regulator
MAQASGKSDSEASTNRHLDRHAVGDPIDNASPFDGRADRPVAHPSSDTYERVQTKAKVLDLDAHLVLVSGHPIRLRPMEQRLLSLLSQSPNRVVRTQALVEALYGNIDVDAGRLRLRRLAADIRSRLGKDLARRLRTMHKVGLVLTDCD